MRIFASTLLLALSLAGCGGGGGGGTQLAPAWQSGVFKPVSTFADMCAAPRMGTDPITNVAYPDRAGTLLDENNWLRSWNNDLYLWYSEVTDLNPANYSTTKSYFDLLKTAAVTPSGAPKDKFHFLYDTLKWEKLALTGTQFGYGAQWIIFAGRPPRSLVVIYNEPNSPAAAANFGRGASLLSVDGVDFVNASDQASVDIINAGLFPVAANQTHSFVVQYPGGSPQTISMISADVATASVQGTTTFSSVNGPVGYMLFNDHLATAEAALFKAFTTVKAAKVSDLIIDIRYNGGGYLDIASEVAYMVAGPAATAGKTFELTQFNSKHSTIDPITNKTIVPVPFQSTSLGFAAGLAANQQLPTLSLPRVFVLTGPDTCSASEAIINGLRGAGVEVIQIGSTTCGKPYGFYPADNCGTTYFSIQFRGLNQLNFGDYADGFSPQNAPVVMGGTPVGVSLPGCSVADDLNHQLGDPLEARLAVALAYQGGNTTCPVPATGFAKGLKVQSRAGNEGYMPASPLRALMLPRPLR